MVDDARRGAQRITYYARDAFRMGRNGATVGHASDLRKRREVPLKSDAVLKAAIGLSGLVVLLSFLTLLKSPTSSPLDELKK